MKVLILQLARLGDIFQTWPTVHALQRGGAEVHMLVRSRFAAAARCCDGLSRVHEFKTEKLLGSILQDASGGLQPSLEALDSLLHELECEKYDRIINLSFSPLSSWITFDLEMRAFQSGRAIAAAGYTRHADGALAIPDDASAYFFAQVGYRVQTGATEGVNRISLARLFATIAGVDPIESDWRGPRYPMPLRERLKLPEQSILVHVGASEDAKTLSAAHWGEVVARLVRRSGRHVVLLGAPNEKDKAAAILKAVESHGIKLDAESGFTSRVISLVGVTIVEELFEIMSHASLLIAGDSVMAQIASLVRTPVLNLSSRTVSHWETGPLSPHSRILVYGGAAPATEQIVAEATSMLAHDHMPSVADRIVSGPLEPVVEQTHDGYADFLWRLVGALYLGSPFPKNADAQFQSVLTQWHEIQNIENSQLCALRDGTGDPRQIVEILERVDELTKLLVQSETRLAPIERWWTTERVRLGPQPPAVLIEKYLNLNSQLESVLLSLREIEGLRDGHQLDI